MASAGDNAILADSLRTQHEGLSRRIRAFLERTPTSVEVHVFGATLRAHLQMEDARLYPALTAQGALGQTTAKSFQSSMNSLAQLALAFVEKWSHEEPASDSARFSAELMEVARSLDDRIAREEKDLYPLLRADHRPPDYMPWKDDYATGIKTIDDQHLQLS